MLVTTLKSHTEQVCGETFLDGNGDISSLLECVTVTKGHMMEILENPYRELVERLDRTQRKDHKGQNHF